ncbi:MAG: T9SS type A sorting domain-containing protein [FCB group bacterium]|nr:T9SS type A sorting domain-containing protein [FCB group bacterium]MBL7120403.1 T9SS type A sorting domain-containing protein [Candidatus Neomarinimicrobiota bacterium]
MRRNIPSKLMILGLLLFAPILTMGQAELLLNNSFETWDIAGTDGPPDYWRINNTERVSASQETELVYDGDYSIRLDYFNTANGELIQDDVPITGGQEYVFSMWALDTDSTMFTKFLIKWFDATGSACGSTHNSDPSRDSLEWQEITTGVLVAPDCATNIQFKIRTVDVDSSWTGTGFVHVDKASVIIPGATGIPGCTDVTACNYDPRATEDDGSCLYTCTFIEQNGSFETWADSGDAGPPDFWALNNPEAFTVSKGTEQVLEGDYSAEANVTSDDGNREMNQNFIPVFEGGEYEFSSWFYDSDPGVKIKLLLRWDDVDSLSIGSSLNTAFTTDLPIWQTISTGLQTAPEGAVFASIKIRYISDDGYDGDATTYVDGVRFKSMGDPSSIAESRSLPVGFRLLNNYPNPFNPSTMIPFELYENSIVELAVFDMQGNHMETLVHGSMDAGYHELSFSPDNLATGMYFYRLRVGTQTLSQKLVYLK